MINRVTSSSSSTLMLADLGDAQRALTDIQRQVASGKRMQRASDSPAEAVATLDHRGHLRRAEQLDRNSDSATQWLEASDRTNQTVIDQLNQARSLVVQAQSGANDASSRTAIANQLLALRQSMLGTANSTVMGRPLYGGTTAATTAYDAAGAYLGDGGAVTLPVNEGVSLQVTRTGPEVFGTYNATTPTSGDAFQLLSSLAASVQANDVSAISAGLTQIDGATTRVQGVQVELGSRLSQLEQLRSAGAVHRDELSASISQLEDVDVAEAAITLKTREASYQAALQVTARIIQQSLMDFLR